MAPDQLKPWATADSGRLKGPTNPPPREICEWQRVNPHPLNLGRIRFVGESGQCLQPSEIRVEGRRLDLWSGLLVSRFLYRGEPVEVETCVAPRSDTAAVRVASRLLAIGRLKVRLDFPAPAPGDNRWLGDYSKASGHDTTAIRVSSDRILLKRQIDDTSYHTAWTASGLLDWPNTSSHNGLLAAQAGRDTLEFTCRFDRSVIPESAPGVAEIQSACIDFWPSFWQGGGAIDLSESRDFRWMELERRVVLSQHQLAVQSAGDYPPAEVGLTGTDPWHAKWHFEMIWWHLAHYALWDRWEDGGQGSLHLPKTQPRRARLCAKLWLSRPDVAQGDGPRWPSYETPALSRAALANSPSHLRRRA